MHLKLTDQDINYYHHKILYVPNNFTKRGDLNVHLKINHRNFKLLIQLENTAIMQLKKYTIQTLNKTFWNHIFFSMIDDYPFR